MEQVRTRSYTGIHDKRFTHARVRKSKSRSPKNPAVRRTLKIENRPWWEIPSAKLESLRALSLEVEDNVASPVLPPYKICGWHSRVPFALYANFVQSGAAFALYLLVTSIPDFTSRGTNL